jgi:hypothetical protein
VSLTLHAKQTWPFAGLRLRQPLLLLVVLLLPLLLALLLLVVLQVVCCAGGLPRSCHHLLLHCLKLLLAVRGQLQVLVLKRVHLLLLLLLLLLLQLLLLLLLLKVMQEGVQEGVPQWTLLRRRLLLLGWTLLRRLLLLGKDAAGPPS